MPSHQDAAVVAGIVRDEVPFSRFPWVRPLVHAHAQAYASVAPLFTGNPADPSAWRDGVARAQRRPVDRALIANALDAQLDRRESAGEARAAAALLRNGDAVAVVTGQQAGLFGGPLYTLLKAVTTIQLARSLRAEHGVAAVPVFWVDAEDHDWDEVRSANVLDRELNVSAVSLDDLEGCRSRPVGALQLDDRVTATIDGLERSLVPSEFTAELLASLRRRYRPGETMGSAFAGWIDDLLGSYGLVVFESGDTAVKPAAAPLFAAELAHPTRTARLTKEAAAAMQRLGHAPQIEPADDVVGLFYLDGQGRRAIRYRDGQYLVGDEPHEPSALEAEAASHPERFSPNVLLRPIVQDRIFPTVCYVAGPSELAYQAQLRAAYEAFGVEAPLLCSRASVTLLDSAAAKFLDKHGLALEALQPQDDSTLNRLLEAQLPPAIEQTFDETERQVAGQAAKLREAIQTVDPTLTGAVDTTVEKIRDTLKTLQNKVVQASKRKDDTLRRQFTRTRCLAFPGGEPQERVLSVAFFINRYGPALPGRLLDALPAVPTHHYLLAP